MISFPTNPFHVLEGEIETEYRSFRQEEEVRSLVVAGLVVSVAVLAFIDADLQLVASLNVTRLVIAVRVVLVALIATAFLATKDTQDHTKRDRWVVACAFGVVTLDFVAAVSRPVGFTGNVAMSPVIALLLYVVIPGPQKALAAAASTESVGAVAAAALNQAPFSVLFSLTGALVLANWLGLVAMSRMNHWGREQFLTLRSLTETNRSLESALAEVRTLREIIPVCASCKSVRDDEGFWQRVEVYATRHEGGQVSHGLCPPCAERLYGLTDEDEERAPTESERQHAARKPIDPYG